MLLISNNLYDNFFFLALEWDAPAKSQIIADDRDFIEEHASVKQVAKCPEEATSVSLQECFRYKKHPAMFFL